MNNQQFRRLVLDTPSTTSNKSSVGATPRRDGVSSSTLGSRMRSSIPMTPRSVAGSSGVDFARQLREQNAPATNGKRFRSSAAPKGTKLASGYQDRTQLRTSAEEDGKAARIQALEDMVKLGQMEQATFEALRDEIVGGDVKDVHLVKGLDWKLLERVRRGEDVLAEKSPEKADQADGPVSGEDEKVDEALEDLEGKDITPLAKEERKKKGEMAPPPAGMAGKKRTRDDILRELKESRLKAAEEKKAAQQPSLGPKFKKLGAKQEKSRIEKDKRGRDVLITVDEDGNVKRKVKKAKMTDQAPHGSNGLLMPDRDAKPLGMEVPEILAPEPPPEEDIDIFEGVGNDYDPLGGMNDDDDDDTDDEEDDGLVDDATEKKPAQPDDIPTTAAPPNEEPSTLEPSSRPSDMPPPPPRGPSRNYFTSTSDSTTSSPAPTINPLTEPTILAALKKAASIKPLSSSDPPSAEESAKLARRKRMLEGHNRDAEDMDLGFGSSRAEDVEDGEDKKVKLSVWGGGGDGKGEKGQKGEERKERKRGGKRRRGDKNSAVDVLRVMERRREEGGGEAMKGRPT